ncbi:DUF2268 domain-containing protein [Bacillus dakarensis]|uniref:DUF2268 domain-containing protein n=1 Tax=Robertmurraya dakarensis TaxID=1926278 RepID=UPI000980ED54|nr:DUF2268 domain-containing protein [Bacillus dakarensis]
MGVIRTDQWLLESYDQPLKMCEKMKSLFSDARSSSIYHYLTRHGMYQPVKDGIKTVIKLRENKVWEMVQQEKQRLRRLWEGPDVPVYIFPSDQNNKVIASDFNGKSGLAFKDKLFLFLTENNEEKEIRALFTHEYNHVCRLAHIPKKEENFVLLDTIIMEGLAENAVRERIGNEFLASWTTYYSDVQLEKLWKNLLLPNRDLPKEDRKHRRILYGLGLYPKMAGYCVGYYLVRKYMEDTNDVIKELMKIETEKIAGIEL